LDLRRDASRLLALSGARAERPRVFERSRGALFLDRDGVLNEKAPEGDYVREPDAYQLLPGVAEALAALRSMLPGLRIAVVTNQRGIATGKVTDTAAAAVNQRLRDDLASSGVTLDRIEVCPHDDGVCDCRKPATGMFERALRDWPEIVPARSAVIGDSAVDMLAGHRIGARTFLVGQAERRIAESNAARRVGAAPDEEADSLPTLVADGRLTAWLSDGTITRASSRRS
jgi:D-glycero-D-manno-heptose 1,7-bisphosphate phosphatase